MELCGPPAPEEQVNWPRSIREQANRIRQGRREYFNLPGIPDQCLDLVKRCLDYNASTRITVGQALDHPYFSNPQGWARNPQAEQSAEVRYIEEQDNKDLSVGQWKPYIWTELHEVFV